MSVPATFKWIGLAVLGLAIAATVAIAASQLTSQQIGIASESVTAGDRLAPAVRSANAGTHPTKHRHHHATNPPTAAPTTPPTTTVSPPTAIPPPVTTSPTLPSDSGDDQGGGAGGHGGGGGADD